MSHKSYLKWEEKKIKLLINPTLTLGCPDVGAVQVAVPGKAAWLLTGNINCVPGGADWYVALMLPCMPDQGALHLHST